MSNVIPFRRRPLPPDQAVWSNDGSISTCSELVHVFAKVPGSCQCGSEQWDEVPDRAQAAPVSNRMEGADQSVSLSPSSPSASRERS